MTKYNHPPLNDPSKDCRFLILKPEELANTPWEPVTKNLTPTFSSFHSMEENGMLRGWIIEVPLYVAADRGFCALSYCWGSSSRACNIVLNDSHLLGITLELDTAIRHLETPIIWIDQICIYVDWHQMKDCGNLRFRPPFSEGFRFLRVRSD